MTDSQTLFLSEMTTTDLGAFLAGSDDPILLWPVGSTEPHGPHLPLATDIILAEENAKRACEALRERGLAALVAPPLPYGVTDFAEGFTGAITVPSDTLIDFIVAGATSFIRDGFSHICLINHHLEPGQLKAVKRAASEIARIHGSKKVTAPQVISRRWGSQLGDEFRSGACHAGEYEGSLVLAATPELVHLDRAETLDEVTISLSDAIKAGKTTFLAAGADQAYTGHPATASVDEGNRLYAVLTDMVVTEITETMELNR